MKGPVLLLLLGTLCLCAALNAAAEEPKPEAPAAASAIDDGAAAVMPSQVGLVAIDDKYTVSATPGQPISEVLSVLVNDLPKYVPKEIIGSWTNTNNYGRITIRDTDILYEVDSYDGRVHNDMFRYTMINKQDGRTTATAWVYVTVRPGNPNGDLIARDDTFKFEWSVGYHVELLDVLANDSGTGLRITNAKGAGMVGELGTSSTQVIYMVDQYRGQRINDVFSYEVEDAAGRVRMAQVVVRVSESQVPVGAVAQPDSYNFRLSKNGNLAPKLLDVLGNDAGTGIRMVRFTFPQNNLQGNLRWSSARNKFVYQVVGYRGDGFTTTFDYTIGDTAGMESSTTVTIRVAAAIQPDIPVNLKDDFEDVGFPQGGKFTWDVYVLDNDKPFGNLKLLGVDRLGPGWGTMRMDSTNTFFYYTVDTNAMPKGMRFTDKFKYTAGPRSSTGSERTAFVTLNVVITPKLK